MSDLPAPLTPPECDLRGLPFMPLDVVRLVDSDLVALSTGDEFKAAVILWAKAWLQVPAASLPDDDRILAHLSGTGARWAKLRAVALRGWIKCSDGRLYHPVVASKAQEAWAFRVRQRERSARANAIRWGSSTQSPPASQEASPRGSPSASPDDPKGQGQGQGHRKEQVGATPSQGGAGGSAVAKGARLPADWRPSVADAEFARGLNLDPERTAASFRDYWHGKAGADGRKADWPATWRNWCRRDAERRPTLPRLGQGKPRGEWAWEEMGMGLEQSRDSRPIIDVEAQPA